MGLQPAIAPINGSQTGVDAPQRSLSKKSSEISFDASLKDEQEKLQEKQKTLSYIPWAEIEGIFNSLPLKFDFQFSPPPKEFDSPKRDLLPSPPQKSDGDKGQGGRVKEASDRNCAEKISYTMGQKVFLQNLMANIRPVMGNPVIPLDLSSVFGLKTRGSNLELIVSEIVDKIKLVEEGKKVELSVALKPDQMGELLLNMSMKNGLVSVSIIADGEAKEWIEQNIAGLKESLKQANISLGDVSVSGGNDRRSAYAPSDAAESLNALMPYLQTTEKIPAIESGQAIDPFLYARYWGLLSDHRIFSRA